MLYTVSSGKFCVDAKIKFILSICNSYVLVIYFIVFLW
jgi:hypothetical protein